MRSFIRALIVTTAIMLPVAAQAQAIDYAALEEALGEPVTNSVTGKPQRASEAPASLVIITREQIAASAARSVPALLKAYAGVDVNRWTAGQTDVAVRGGVQTYNARLLVLVNGRQVYLDHYGMTDWNLLGVQLGEIQQIELVKGPASALFGFNAASGVVNIITTDPLGARHGAATAELGNHSYARVGANAALPLSDTIGLNLSAGYQRENERRIPTAFYRPANIDNVYAAQAAATLVAKPDAATRIELNGGWAANRQLEFLPSQVLTQQRFRSETVGVLVNRDTDWGILTAHGYTNWLSADYGVGSAPTDAFAQFGAIRTDNRIIVLDGSTIVRLNDADTLRLGAEYRDNQLYSGRLFSHRVGYTVASANGMIDLHPVDSVAVTLAGRIDRLQLSQGGALLLPQIDTPADYDRTIVRSSFNAAVLVHVSQTGQFRINGGRGLQLPSLIDFGIRTKVPDNPFALFPIYIAGDPRLDPSSVWSVEAGYTQHFGDALRLDGTIFYTRTTEAIATPGDGLRISVMLAPTPIAVSRFANVGSFDTYGLEISASGRLSPAFGWQANYTFTKVDQDLPPDAAPFAFAFSPRRTTPRHVANLGLDYRHARWFGNLLGHYTSRTDQFSFTPDIVLRFFRVSEAINLDAKIGYKLTPQMSVYAAGENLGNTNGALGSPIPADRRVRVGLSFAL